MWSAPTIVTLATLYAVCAFAEFVPSARTHVLPLHLESRQPESLQSGGASDGSGIAQVTYTDDKQSEFTG